LGFLDAYTHSTPKLVLYISGAGRRPKVVRMMTDEDIMKLCLDCKAEERVETDEILEQVYENLKARVKAEWGRFGEEGMGTNESSSGCASRRPKPGSRSPMPYWNSVPGPDAREGKGAACARTKVIIRSRSWNHVFHELSSRWGLSDLWTILRSIPNPLRYNHRYLAGLLWRDMSKWYSYSRESLLHVLMGLDRPSSAAFLPSRSSVWHTVRTLCHR